MTMSEDEVITAIEKGCGLPIVTPTNGSQRVVRVCLDGTKVYTGGRLMLSTGETNRQDMLTRCETFGRVLRDRLEKNPSPDCVILYSQSNRTYKFVGGTLHKGDRND